MPAQRETARAVTDGIAPPAGRKGSPLPLRSIRAIMTIHDRIPAFCCLTG